MKKLLTVTITILLLLQASTAPLIAAARCDPRVVITATAGTPEELAAFKQLLSRLDRLNRATTVAWNGVALDCLEIIDPSATNVVNVHTWIQIVVVTAQSDEQAAAVIRAVNSLRDELGVLFAGLVTKTGSRDYSVSWMNSAKNGNRGHLFEVIAAAYLLNTGTVLRERVVGMGIRLQRPDGTYLFEGDLVDELPSGNKRYFDFKADGGNYDVATLDKIDEALRQGWIGEFVFVYEHGTSPPADWLARLGEINRDLSASGLPTIKLIDGGLMP
jgi:hypothetical protein